MECYTHTMIGNENDARLALLGRAEFVGEGCTRTVFRVGDVAYKVCDSDHDYNMDEYAEADRVRPRLPNGIRIPEMSIHRVGERNVLAMEYIDGLPMGECVEHYGLECTFINHEGCLPDDIEATLEGLNGDAISHGNTILANGVYYIVDLGTP